MSRLLLTCLPYYSHLAPMLVPAAHAVQRLGHTVAVATAPAMADELARHEIEHVPLPHVPTLHQLLENREVLASPGMPGAEDEDAAETARAREEPGALAKAYAGPLAGAFARDVLAADWKPDMIVRECNEFGGYLAAAKLGVPQAVMDISPLIATQLPVLHDSLNEQLAALGVAPADSPSRPHEGLVATTVPAEWYPESLRTPSLRSYRTDLPDAVGRLSAPLVVAGVGTVALTVVPEARALLETMAAALGELPVTAVLAVGTAAADWSGPRPGNVRIVPFAPQQALLLRSVLYVSHGGFGGVQQALRSGTPMVNLPFFADQPATARRVAELGLGLHLDPGEATAETLAGACARVLADNGFQERATRFARLTHDAPDFDILAEDLAAWC